MIFTLLLILTLLLIVLIKIKGYFVLKTILIPVVLWYSLSLYYSTQNLKGWPAYLEPLDDTVIVGYIIEEPTKTDKGCIYLFCVSRDYIQKRFPIDPRLAFDHDDQSEPRLYRIPYSGADRNAIKNVKRNLPTVLMYKRGSFIDNRGTGKMQKSTGGIKRVPATEVYPKE